MHTYTAVITCETVTNVLVNVMSNDFNCKLKKTNFQSVKCNKNKFALIVIAYVRMYIHTNGF